MKYVVIHEKSNDIFTKEFNSIIKAVDFANRFWTCLSDFDKKHCSSFYVIKSVNPDEHSENHFDGNVVKKFK